MNLQIKERLEETLKKYGVSQSRAAKDIGYTPGVISTYLREPLKT